MKTGRTRGTPTAAQQDQPAKDGAQAIRRALTVLRTVARGGRQGERLSDIADP